MAAEILPCDCAPGGSVLVYTGTNSGGRGSQYFFQRGEGDDTEHSVSFDRKWHAEQWAREGMIKFHPRNKSGGQPSKTKGEQSSEQQEQYA